MIGTTLAHYRITGELGAGGMGEVWRAQDTRLGRDVALKVLSEEFADDPERLERFEREARAVATLNHPHIVTIFSVEEAEGVRFLTMELIEGRSLDKLILEGGLDVATFLELATPLAEAISAAHDKSIVHRDLKPSNVMVDAEGRVKVLDFGLAKVSGAGGVSDSSELPTEALTGVGTLVGTVPYMSPEQIEGKFVDHRTDIFSLGVLLYEMATGNRPFAGDNQPALMSSILKDVPSSVIEIRDDLPNHLGRIITRCLEKDRRDRYQTARDVFNELRALKLETTGDSRSPMQSSPRPAPVRRGGHRAIAVAPFRAPSKSEELTALAEGLAEDIAAGLARFPYLTILEDAGLDSSDSSVSAAAGVGARYVLRGGLRSAGSEVRLSVQIMEVATGAHVWSEAYDRLLDGVSLFELQDDLTDRIVATVGDYSGVIPRLVVNELRAMDDDEMGVDDWIMRAVCYVQVIHPPEEHAAIRDGLEKMVERHPDNAEAHAWLANTYVNEFAFGFNPLEDPIGRSLQAAQRAVDLDPTSQAGWLNLAGGHFFLGDMAAFEAAATRAMALNPRNSYAIAYMGLCLGNSGQRERGAQLGTRACALNPHHPEWYPFVNFYHLYAREEYEEACSVIKGINWPKFPYTHINFAAACGQLGRPDEARSSIETLRDTFGFDLEGVRAEFVRWGHTEDFVEHILDGLRKAGMDGGEGSTQSSTVEAPSQPGAARARPGGEFDLKSIAVLPFVNMSEDAANEFFSDGVTEEILTGLSKINGLHVISRTSAMAYRGTSKSIREIAAELGVGSVLEGSVRRAGDRVRVTAQLIEAATDKNLWSESYDRDLEDIFEVQSEVALEIARALETELASDVVAQIRQRPTVNMEAYDLYLKGRQEVRTLRAAEILRGIERLEQAVALDENFAPAHAELALAHLRSAYWGAARGKLDFDDARKAADRALELDQANAVALVARAGARCLNDLDWGGAVDDFHEAIRLDPNEMEAHHWLGMTLFLMGRFDEAVAAQEAALSLDPQSPNVASHLGLALFFSGRHEEGERMLLDGIDHHPVFFDFPNMLGVALKRQDKFDESASWYERACELTARHPIFEAVRASALRLGGSTVEAEEIVRMLRDSGDDPRVDSIARALIAVAKHDLDAALRHFHEAADQRLPLIFWCLRAVLRDREFPAKDPGVQALWRRLWPHELEMAGGATSGDVAIPNEAGSREMSIVVLPFANLSPDPDTEYFSDGLTDEIITDLSRVRALRVISRSSAMRLKDDERGLAAVGRDLDCRYVLEGSVRRAANTLRITARLVDAPEDVQIWSDKYGGTLDDVFDIQERVSRSIVDALEIQLTPQEAEQLAERPIDDVRAQESYLRARSEIWSFMPGGLDLAVSHLQSALDLIGDNALIYQGLGETYFQYVNIGAAIGREEELIRKAEDCVDRIFTLEPESPRGYLVRAQTQMARGDIHGSVGSLRRVLQSFPNEIVALQLYTHALGWLGGKPDAATPVAARLVDVDPLNPMSLLVSAMVPLFAGRFSEGVEAARRMFDLDPVTPVWRSNFVMALSYARQFDEAEALTEGVAAEPDSDIATWQMGLCRAAWREDHAEVLRLADGPYQRVATWDAEVPWLLASAHAAVGARDEALHWLDLAIDQGMINYPFLSEHDWCLDGIRGDERFGGAMERARREWERLDEVLP